jgi:hypothetical protein
MVKGTSGHTDPDATCAIASLLRELNPMRASIKLAITMNFNLNLFNMISPPF